MKNEIGRKLTSLTIMAIMFAGGMAIGVPSFMPGAASDLSVTEGMLTVSSTEIQGAAILEIVVNDPAHSDTTVDNGSGPVVTVQGNDYDAVQAVNGKWYLYYVDESSSVLMDGDTTGMEFGIHCSSGLGIDGTAGIIASGTDVWVAVLNVAHQGITTEAATVGGGCLNADGMQNTLDDSPGTTTRADLTEAVLQGAPALSNHDATALGGVGIDLGQRGHGLNESGYGSWPYIVTNDEFAEDTIVEYGSDAISVTYGNTSGSIALVNNSPADLAQIHLSISDAALNIDPTTADVWIFDLNALASEDSVVFANNGSNTAMSPAQLGEMGCDDNCRLYSDSVTELAGYDDVTMTESGASTGVFESWDVNGSSQITTKQGVSGDSKTVFSYDTSTIDMIITYNSAAITMESDGQWEPGTAVTISVTDNDANRNPGSTETLNLYDETVVVPTIIVGSPKTLAGGNNPNLTGPTATNHISGVTIGEGAPGTEGAYTYAMNIVNTTDNSERLRIIHTGGDGNILVATETWINVTTGHTRSDLMNLAGTVVLSYDITGPADLLQSTDINVYVTDSGDNTTSNSGGGEITIVEAGNVKAGVYDLDDGSQYLKQTDSASGGGSASTWTGDTVGTAFVTVNFQLTHAAANVLTTSADYAISADFCNFDQNNGSLTHNCIYRLAAVETGQNTGVFEGTVEYLTLNNSTTLGTLSGEHDGNDEAVEDFLTAVGGEDLIVVLMDSVSGSDSVRVVYNDTDALGAADKIGAQLATVTHTGTVDLDLDSYGAGDMGTITIVDADLNQDSSIRDTYENSTTTFQLTITDVNRTNTKPFETNPMTIIETSAGSGVFVGTFKVPDFKGSDMEITYYESKDAGGSAVEYYDTATITSTSGSISLDRSVYPVPWTANDLSTGDAKTTVATQTEAGKVTAWITITDVDETGDTLTTNTTAAVGAVLVKITKGTATETCFTAGSQDGSWDAADDLAQELGYLSEVSPGSSTYEISMTISEKFECGTDDITVQSGDVIQVEYVDTANDAGVESTFYDSSTFDLRTGTLSVDKDVYVMGSDMVVTITDPDLNLDSSSSESYNMSLIEWDSSADSSELLNQSSFTSNPSSLEETGSDTGVFQTVVTLPTTTVGSGDPEYGESVTLTYVDVGLSGESDVAGDTLDVETTFSISNFGALVELDKAVYNWTDTVYITITSPDHNNNSAAEESIGTSALPIQVTSRLGKMCPSTDIGYYVADETGPDTGVFAAEVGLVGKAGTGAVNDPSGTTACSASSTGGKLGLSGQTDGISVSYEYTNNVVVVSSASILWNISEAGFDTSSASAGGSAVLTVSEPDENTDNAIIDTVEAAVFSDSDNGGFTLTLNETDEDTGVFEGTVFFTADSATSGSNLRVSEGDTVTAEYSDTTLPEPYTDTDTLTIASTLTIGTAFPPLERAPAANARVVDAFGASVAEVSVDQQVQIAADVSNGQSSDQAFAYLVQVQDENGVTVSLAWITGSLTAGQAMSPALSWTPSAAGSYTATVFVWESVDNPTALSPTTSVTIDVV